MIASIHRKKKCSCSLVFNNKLDWLFNLNRLTLINLWNWYLIERLEEAHSDHSILNHHTDDIIRLHHVKMTELNFAIQNQL